MQPIRYSIESQVALIAADYLRDELGDRVFVVAHTIAAIMINRGDAIRKKREMTPAAIADLAHHSLSLRLGFIAADYLQDALENQASIVAYTIAKVIMMSQFEIIWKSPKMESSDIEEADEVLIGEYHEEDAVQRLQIECINLFGRPNDIVLCESVQSLHYLDPKLVLEVYSKQVHACAYFDSDALTHQATLFPQQESNVGWEEGYPLYNLIHYGWDLEREITEESRNNKKLFEKEKRAWIRDSFPARTTTMVRTLETLAKTSFGARCFLIAGLAHVLEEEYLPDPNECLAPLYASLGHRKAIIISSKMVMDMHRQFRETQRQREKDDELRREMMEEGSIMNEVDL